MKLAIEESVLRQALGALDVSYSLQESSHSIHKGKTLLAFKVLRSALDAAENVESFYRAAYNAKVEADSRGFMREVAPRTEGWKAMSKKQPTGFVATCQCGVIVGAMDYTRADRKDAGQMLGKWLHDGCTVEPRFAGTWKVAVEACRCEPSNAEITGSPKAVRWNEKLYMEVAMGWDGFANNTRGHKAKFKAAAKAVVEKCGTVDGWLETGALDCSACAFALEAATGQSAWDADGWSAKKVKRLAAEARWPDEVESDRCWAVESAKAFLNLCAEIGTGIQFSW